MERILIVEDQKGMRESMVIAFQMAGYDVDEACSGEEAMGKIRKSSFDLVLTDLKMEGIDGINLLKRIKEMYPQTEVIVVTGHGSIQSAVEAIKQGAYDYLTKPFHPEELLVISNKALERGSLVKRVRNLEEQVRDKYSFEGIVGNSPAIQKVIALIKQIAKTDSTVLITGESGTGKELIAKALHNNSLRSRNAFVTINCGAIPDNLQESELFGHTRGAFTGAVKEKKGLFEEGNNGTIFLDEISNTSLSTQSKLLRFLQYGEIRRIGDNKTIYVNVRLIAATNQDLSKEVREGKFREDLFYRLNVIPVVLPPLRDRKVDIPLLAQHFLEDFALKMERDTQKISKKAMDLLMGYSWPGNIRELQSTIERAMAMNTSDMIECEDLLLPISTVPATDTSTLNIKEEVAEFEKLTILKALEMTDGRLKEAATALDMSDTTLWRKMKKYGIKHTFK
ncbi:MAG: sigma-54 dependent transcriptional regulator [Pseudomonadota bacterium]